MLPSLSSALLVKTNRSGGTISRYSPTHGYSPPSGARITIRQAPPTRTSASQTELVQPLGPHHLAKCAGSVQALNTSSRGASKTRVRTTSRSMALFAVRGSLALLADIFCLLLLHF